MRIPSKLINAHGGYQETNNNGSRPHARTQQIFMTPDQLHELTGLKRPTFQTAWLREVGIPYLIGADGMPKVLLSAVENRLNQNDSAYGSKDDHGPEVIL